MASYQPLGEITRLPSDVPSSIGLPVATGDLDQLKSLKGYLIPFYGIGSSRADTITKIGSTGYAPVNRLESARTVTYSEKNWIGKAITQFGFEAHKVYYIPLSMYMRQAGEEPDLFRFIDYLKLAECAGVSFDEKVLIEGFPVRYQGYTTDAVASYVILANRFREKVVAYYAEKVIAVMTITRWEDMFTVSQAFNHYVNLLSQIPARIHASLSVMIEEVAVRDGSGSTVLMTGPITTGQPRYVSMTLPPEIRDMLLKTHADIYLTTLAGKLLDMAARTWELMTPGQKVMAHNENLDPGKNPFLVIDLDATQKSNTPIYKNLAKAFAIGSVPSVIIPGQGPAANVVPPASAEAYGHVSELMTARLRVINLSTGLSVSPDEIGGTRENPMPPHGYWRVSRPWSRSRRHYEPLPYGRGTVMTYLEADIPDLGLLEKIKAGQMPTAKEIFSSEMLPFVIAAVAIPVALVLASKLKKRRKKTVPRP